MVGEKIGGVLLADGSYWFNAEKRQKDTLQQHYHGLFLGDDKTTKAHAKKLWTKIMDGGAGAYDANIFHGALHLSGADMVSNCKDAVAFQKLLESNVVVQDHVLSTVFGGEEAKITDASKLATIIGNVEGLNESVVHNAFYEGYGKLNQVFKYHTFALSLFQNCPTFVERLSGEALLGFALHNPGAAYCVFADARLREKALAAKGGVSGKQVTTLLAKVPDKEQPHSCTFFEGLFVNFFGTEKNESCLLTSGLLQKAAQAGSQPQIAAVAGHQEQTTGHDAIEAAAVGRLREHFYVEHYSPDTVNYHLADYLQQHQNVVAALCGGSDNFNLGRFLQLLNLFPDPLVFIAALTSKVPAGEAIPPLRTFIIANLPAVLAQVKANMAANAAQATSSSLVADHKRVDAFLCNPQLVAGYCGQGINFNLGKLLELTSLSEDPVGFLSVLAKNPTTRDFIIGNIGAIVLHVQKTLGERTGSSPSQVKKQLNRLLHVDTKAKCTMLDGKDLGKSLRRYLYREFFAEGQAGEPEDAKQERQECQRALFANDHVRGQLNFNDEFLSKILAQDPLDQTMCLAIASDENLWTKAKKMYTKELSVLQGKSKYFEARMLLEQKGGLSYESFKRLQTAMHNAVSTLIAVRPNLFWPKITKKPEYTSWMKFVRFFSKKGDDAAKAKYREFNQYMRGHAVLGGMFAPVGASQNADETKLELKVAEEENVARFSKYAIEQAKRELAFFSADAAGNNTGVLKRAVCEGASPEELAQILVSRAGLEDNKDDVLLQHVLANSRTCNKLLRSSQQQLTELCSKLPLASALRCFNEQGNLIFTGEKAVGLQVSLVARLTGILGDKTLTLPELAKINAIAGNLPALKAPLLQNCLAKSSQLFMQNAAGDAVPAQLLSELLQARAVQPQVLDQANFTKFVEKFINNGSPALEQTFFANVSAETLAAAVIAQPELFAKVLLKLKQYDQSEKIHVFVGQISYNQMLQQELTVRQALALECLDLFSLGDLLHLFNLGGDCFTTNEEFLRQVKAKILEKSREVVAFEEFEKLAKLKLQGESGAGNFEETLFTDFARNWVKIFDKTALPENKDRQFQFTKKLLLEDTVQGKIFRQNVSSEVLLKLSGQPLCSDAEWTGIIANLFVAGNKAALVNLWQQDSSLLAFFAPEHFGNLVTDPAVSASTSASLTLENLLNVFADDGKARYELGQAHDAVVNAIITKICAKAKVTAVTLANLEKCSKLALNEQNAGQLMDFYLANWDAYNAQNAATNSSLTAHLLSAENVCGKFLRESITVDILQKITPSTLATATTKLWQSKPELVRDYLDAEKTFAAMEAKSAVVSALVSQTDYLAKAHDLSDVLRFFEAATGKFCGGEDAAGVAGKQKCVARLNELLAKHLADEQVKITSSQISQLLAIQNKEISTKVYSFATKNWDGFVGLPADLRAKIINDGVRTGSVFATKFLSEHTQDFAALAKSDEAFGRDLSLEVYRDLLLAVVHNSREAAQAEPQTAKDSTQQKPQPQLEQVLALIEKHGKQEALLLFLAQSDLEFVQKNRQIFMPLCQGQGLKVLEEQGLAEDYAKFFDSTGNILPGFDGFLQSPQIVAKIIATGKFTIVQPGVAEDIEQSAELRQGNAAAAGDKLKATQRSTGGVGSESADVLAQLEQDLVKVQGELDVVKKGMNLLREQLVAAINAEQAVLEASLKQQLEVKKIESNVLGPSIKSLEQRIEREKARKQNGSAGHGSVLDKFADARKAAADMAAQKIKQVAKSGVGAKEPAAADIAIKPIVKGASYATAGNAKLSVEQVAAVVKAAQADPIGLELAMARLRQALSRGGQKTGAMAQLQQFVADMFEKEGGNRLLGTIISSLQGMSVPEKTVIIRGMERDICNFLQQAQPGAETGVVLRVLLQLDSAQGPSVKNNLPVGIVKAVADFFAAHSDAYGPVLLDATEQELALILRNNCTVLVAAIKTGKLSPAALNKVFSGLGREGNPKAQEKTLVDAIADNYEAGLLFFEYLHGLSPDKRERMQQPASDFIGKWWGKHNEIVTKNIETLALSTLVQLLSHTAPNEEGFFVAKAIFASAKGALACVDRLTVQELKKYEALILPILPQTAKVPAKAAVGETVKAEREAGESGLSHQELLARKLASRRGQTDGAGSSTPTAVASEEARGEFLKQLQTNSALIEKLLAVGSDRISKQLCSADITCLLRVLDCGEPGLAAVKKHKVEVRKLLANNAIAPNVFLQFTKEHWSVLIAAEVNFSLEVYQRIPTQFMEEFLFSEKSPLRMQAIIACPEFFTVNSGLGTLGGFPVASFSDEQLKALLSSASKDQQSLFGQLIFQKRPQVIAGLFEELNSQAIAGRWAIFVPWLNQQLAQKAITKEQILKLIQCGNQDIKKWLLEVCQKQPELVGTIFDTQESIVGNEQLFAAYLKNLPPKKITAAVVQKCLGTSDQETLTWLGALHGKAPEVVTQLLNSLTAEEVQQNYVLFKPALKVGQITIEQLAKFFTAEGVCIESAKVDVDALFKQQPKMLVDFMQHKSTEKLFMQGFVQGNAELLQGLLPQLANEKAIRAILEYGNEDLWAALFSNEELVKVVLSPGVITALNEQHRVQMLKCLLNGSSAFLLQKDSAAKSYTYQRLVNGCDDVLRKWCGDVNATLSSEQISILQCCFNCLEMRSLFFGIDKITPEQVAVMAKIGDEKTVETLFLNAHHANIAPFFDPSNREQLQSIADKNPAFAKAVFNHGLTHPEVFRTTFIENRPPEYTQKQVNRWLEQAVADGEKGKQALIILFKAFEVPNDLFLRSAYFALPPDKKQLLSETEFTQYFLVGLTKREPLSGQSKIVGSTAQVMGKLSVSDHLEVNKSLLTSEDKEMWSSIAANPKLAQTVQREFANLTDRSTFDVSSLELLALFLSNKLASDLIDSGSLKKALSILFTNCHAKGDGKAKFSVEVSWQKLTDTLKCVAEKHCDPGLSALAESVAKKIFDPQKAPPGVERAFSSSAPGVILPDRLAK